jgi:DNA-binding XRE family transcriptional regulator
MAGVDRKTINRIENGHFSPSLDTMVRLAHAFGVPFGSVADSVSETVGA